MEALSDPRRVLLDVRSEREWQSDGIPSSLNIPHLAIDLNQDLLPVDKETPIIAYCASGVRVRTALASLEKLGYINVYNGVSNSRVKRLLG